MQRIFLVIILTAAAAAGAFTLRFEPGDVTFAPAEGRDLAAYEVVTLRGGIMLPTEPGEPNLPAYAVSVALPFGTEIGSVEVSYEDPMELPGRHVVLPTQNPAPVGEAGGAAVPPDSRIYGSDRIFPGPATVRFESGNAGGYALGSVLVAPVQYHPATGKVVLFRTVTFDVNHKGARWDNVYPQVRVDWLDEMLRADIAAAVINPYDVRPCPTTKLVSASAAERADVFPYLIITNEAQLTEAQKLATWKTKKGYNATVVTTTYIYANYTGVDNAEKIRNCIKDYFTTKGTQFVCLIGTNAVIPVRKVYDSQYQTQNNSRLVPTDNYYGCLDGTFNANNNNNWGEYNGDQVDWTYDVYVGRIQTDTAAALAEVVDKTLCYEGSKASTEVNPYDYQNGVILAGAFLDSSTNERYLMENIRDAFLTSSHWSFTSLWDTTYPGGSVFNSTAFINQMNQGRGIIAHAAHSNSTVIGTNSGSVSASNLYNLTNHPKFTGFLYSLGCYSGDTDVAGNCAAYFVAAPNGGGAGYVGNTCYGWYSPGSPASGFSADFENEYFKVFGSSDIYVNGKTLAQHKHNLQSTVSNWTYRYIYFELMLTGDPDLWVHNKTISPLTVTHAATIYTGNQSYAVHVSDSTDANVAGALVCLWKGTEVYATGLTNASGNVNLTINPTSAGQMYLTVSAHNRRTYEADVTVSVGTGITLESFAAKRTAEGVAVTWRVAPGTKVDGFNLYRRAEDAAVAPTPGGGDADGVAASPLGGGWERVNADLITGRNPYSFLDRSSRGASIYKLEAVMRERQEEVGTTRVTGGVRTAFGVRVFPNPTSGEVKIAVSLPAAGEATARLYDLAGREVGLVAAGVCEAGENVLSYDAAGLPAGVYLLRVEAGDNAAVSRVAVVR